MSYTKSIVPLNLLYPMDTNFRLVSLPSEVGKVPVSWLLYKSSIGVSLTKLPMLTGTVPVSRLPLRLSSTRLVSSPSADGMVPMRLLFSKWM